MKKIIISFFLLITVLSSAKIVPIENIQKVAENWFRYITSDDSANFTDYGLIPVKNNCNLYYFNFKEGFTILSEDNQAVPVLAYDLYNRFSLEKIPPATQQWLQNYADQIQKVQEENIQNSEYENQWNSILEQDFSLFSNHERDVSPLVSTEWEQGNPYNMYCPTESGQHTLVGCVAVAMGQIMKFHNWPENGIGSNSYQWNGQTVSADFESTSYDWNNMPSSLGYGSTTAQKQAVATLLFHCGVGVNMDYGLDGSGSNSEYAEYAMQYYFGYSSSIDLVNKSSYQIEQFNQMLIDNLESSQPIYYAGNDGTMGHAFVLDGYQGSSYFHFNWGWGGWLDGYFYLSNLTPGYSNFNYDQQAIINIKKPVQAFPPQNLNAMVMGSDVMLTWESPTEIENFTGYRIYRGGEEIFYLEGVQSISYFDIGLSAGTHTYFVTSQYYETEYIQPESEPSNTVTVEIGTNSGDENLSTSYFQLTNYPNPFNPTTEITYQLPKDSFVELSIYNTKGELIKKLINEHRSKGNHSVMWDGKNNQNTSVANGVYFYRIKSDNQSHTEKMLLLK